MSYKDTLALDVAAGIANALMKVWLGKTGLAVDLAMTGVAAIKGLALDAFDQRKAKHLVEGIGNEMARRLVTLFEAERADVDEGGREAVAELLARILDDSKLDARTLVAANLDAGRLNRVLQAASEGYPRHLNDAESQMLSRALTEVAESVVAVASQLPAFTETTFAQILKSQDEIFDSVNRILNMLVESKREKEATGQASADRFEVEYRSSAPRIWDRVELFGLRAAPQNRRYNLSVAYIALTVEPHRKRKKRELNKVHVNDLYRGIAPEQLLTASGMGELGSEDAPKSIRSRLSVNELLASSNRLFIRGVAGSGKTTLLQWMAVRAVKRDFTGPLEKYNDYLPFFIRLRHRVQTSFPRPKLVLPQLHEFVSEVEAYTTVKAPPDWVREKLATGRVMVLLDGVDEIDEGDQESLREWVDNLAEKFKGCLFVITARTHLPDNWLDRHGFRSAEIQPMLRADIEEFIDHWHAAVAKELSDPDERLEMPRLAESLKATLRRNSELRRLATNPLLCSMICALHRDGQRQLPTERIRLYRECIEVLVEKREIGANVKITSLPTVTMEQKLVLLRDIAYNFLRAGVSEASRRQVEEWVGNKLRLLTDVPKGLSAEHVLNALIQRSGVIREPTPGSIDFIHKTFQEFLAAQAILDQSDFDALVKNALQDEWLEVAVLATGLASRPVREYLLDTFARQAEMGRTHRHRRASAMLAGACLEATTEAEVQLRSRITSQLKTAVPPENRYEAKMLARAGRFVVPYLRDIQDIEPDVACMCVACLAYTGTNDALATLGEVYARDSRDRVRAELFRCWDFFDRSGFAERVLSAMVGVGGHLVVPLLPSFDGIEAVKGVTALTVTATEYPGPDTVDYASIGRLTGLKRLRIAGNAQTFDMAAISRLNKLSDLRLTGFDGFRNIDGLSGMSKLAYLALSNFRHIEDISPLAGLGQLTHLSLDRSWECRDISALASLKNLQLLELRRFQYLRNVEPLSQLPSLRSLSLNGCPDVSEITSLLSLPKLVDLDIRGTGVKSPVKVVRQHAPVKLRTD